MTMARDWIERIRALDLPERVKVMNVCGGHERSVTVSGMRSALPSNIEIIPGLGCPVCVCPEEDIYQAIQLALHERVTLATFGDMPRVPVNAPKSEPRSLVDARAAGADVRPVASPLEARRIAEESDGPVVFFAAGFETTTAPVASLIREGVPETLSFLLSARLTWPAVAMLLDSGEPGFDALIAPGHVATVMGPEEWEFVPREHGIPAAVAAFTVEKPAGGDLVGAAPEDRKETVPGQLLSFAGPPWRQSAGASTYKRCWRSSLPTGVVSESSPHRGLACVSSTPLWMHVRSFPITTGRGAAAWARCRPAAIAPAWCWDGSIPISVACSARAVTHAIRSVRAWSRTKGPVVSGGAARRPEGRPPAPTGSDNVTLGLRADLVVGDRPRGSMPNRLSRTALVLDNRGPCQGAPHVFKSPSCAISLRRYPDAHGLQRPAGGSARHLLSWHGGRSGGGDVSAWRHADNRIVEPEYAVVKVQSSGETVSCWYEYSAVESGAMEQANPLLAYATLPYQVRVKGRMIKGQALSRAVRQQQVELGQAVVEQARQGLNKAVETARDVVDKVNAR